MYSMRVVSQITGLSADTLRAWERRHAVVVPSREANGRRSYSADDLMRLGLLKQAVDRGYPIRTLVERSNDDLSELITSAGASDEPDAATALRARLLRSVEDRDGEACQRTVSMVLASLPLVEAVEDVLSPVLREAGERWAAGTFAVAQERMLSNAVRGVVAGLLQTLENVGNRPKLALVTLPGERHDLGLSLVSLVAASAGAHCLYLGADLPVEDAASLITGAGCDLAVVGMIAVEGAEKSLPDLANLIQCLGDDTPLWVGGGGAESVAERLPPGATLVRSYREIETRLRMTRL